MKIGRIARSVAGTIILLAAGAEADEGDCAAARYKVAGKYAACEAKAAVKGFDNESFFKCRQKYSDAWTKLGTKHPGTSCAGARFTDNGNTVTDNLTRLEWEKKTTAVDSGANPAERHDVDNVYSWSASSPNADGTTFTDFLADLNSTGFAGQHDWRLPTAFELHSILATDAYPCGAPPCVADPLFSPARSSTYWSSSPHNDTESYAWLVFFSNGDTFGGPRTQSSAVRAVRGGL
jgi:hypothetical protein